MRWASEMMIEEHNALMEDAEYAENYYRETAEAEAWQMWSEEMIETEIDFFDDYKIDHNGYEETSYGELESSHFNDEDLPF